MEPECSEVINGPNLGGFLGLAPDLRRLGRQGLAWLSGTQGLSGPGIWALRSSRQRLPRRPRGTPSQKALSSSSRQDFPAADLPRAAELRRRIFSSLAWLETPPESVLWPPRWLCRRRGREKTSTRRLQDSLNLANFDRDAAVTACKDGIRASKVILALLGGSDPDASYASSSEESFTGPGASVDSSDEDSHGEPGGPSRRR